MIKYKYITIAVLKRPFFRFNTQMNTKQKRRKYYTYVFFILLGVLINSFYLITITDTGEYLAM